LCERSDINALIYRCIDYVATALNPWPVYGHPEEEDCYTNSTTLFGVWRVVAVWTASGCLFALTVNQVSSHEVVLSYYNAEFDEPDDYIDAPDDLLPVNVDHIEVSSGSEELIALFSADLGTAFVLDALADI